MLMEKEEKEQRDFIVKKKSLLALTPEYAGKAYIKIQRKN